MKIELADPQDPEYPVPDVSKFLVPYVSEDPQQINNGSTCQEITSSFVDTGNTKLRITITPLNIAIRERQKRLEYIVALLEGVLKEDKKSIKQLAELFGHDFANRLIMNNDTNTITNVITQIIDKISTLPENSVVGYFPCDDLLSYVNNGLTLSW